MKLKVAKAKKAKKAAARVKAQQVYKDEYKERVDYNLQRRHARAYKRAMSVARFEKFAQMLLACFEKDRQGEWQLYEDRMPELRQAVELGYLLLQKEQKRRKANCFPASGLKAGADSFFD